MINRIKGLIGVIIFGTVLTFPLTAFAGTSGNPCNIDTPKGRGAFYFVQEKSVAIKAGAEFEYLFGRNLHSKETTRARLSHGILGMASLSCAIFDRIAPYGKIGLAQMSSNWTEFGGQQAVLDSGNALAWSVGSKLLIWDFKRPNLKITADGFYRVLNLDPQSATYANSSVKIDPGKSRFLIHEWQTALLLSTDMDLSGSAVREEVLGISTMVPYVGVKYSDVTGRLRIIREDSPDFYNVGNISSDRKVGLVVGCDLSGPYSVSVNLEGRFIDETGMTVGIVVLF